MTATRLPSSRKRVPGRYVAIGLVLFIAIVATVAWSIHKSNLRARQEIREVLGHSPESP